MNDFIPDFNSLDVSRLSDEQLRLTTARVLKLLAEDRKENQLLYYTPVSPVAEAVHCSQARWLGVGGGNGASKTVTVLAELAMLGTGIFSQNLSPDVTAALHAKFRGPVNIRIVVESVTTTLMPIILPKLQWWRWNGIDEPDGTRGHWGWIPRRALKNGSWTQSWQAQNRLLTTLCYDPHDPEVLLGESTWQFMSHEQVASSFASGDFHHIMHDELTSHSIWRENEARTMRVAGRMYLVMTWPDDPAIPVDWVFDELYEQGRPGPKKSKHVDWFEMWSTDNPHLDQDALALQATKWSEAVADVRLRGRPIRFRNRIHPLFTDQATCWCFSCGEPTFAAECPKCHTVTVAYCHVEDIPTSALNPTIFLLDPHPRKPHMGLWVQVDPWDDLYCIAECLVDGSPEELWLSIKDTEERLHLNVVSRIGDPNMLRSPASAQRGVTWQDEFADAGLRIDLADNSDVGRSRVNEFLRPDQDRKTPRLLFHPRCEVAIKQMLRYTWGEWKQPEGRDIKQTARNIEDDFPSLLRYLMNSAPTYAGLQHAGQVLRTRKWR